MITLQITDLKVLKHIHFSVDIIPKAWSIGPINTQQGYELTKSGKPKKLKMGASEPCTAFKQSFSKQAVGYRLSSNSPYFKDTPVFVCFDFFVPRPLDLKDGPAMPLKRPDVTNMQKLAEDVLTELFWADDNTNVTILSSKRYVKTRDIKPHIVTDIYYCGMITEGARQSGFQSTKKGDDMVIVNGHEEEEKALKAEQERKKAELLKENAALTEDIKQANEAQSKPAAKKAVKKTAAPKSNDQSGRVV